MSKIGDAFWRLLIDDKGLKRDAQKSGAAAGKAAGDSASKELTGKLKKSFSGGNLKQGLIQGLGLGAALGGVQALSAGIGMLSDAIGASIDAASDQREALSLNTQVFEDQTDEMQAWADGAADAFGESKTSAMNFASGFGTAFKNVGFALDETADKSQKMTRLAADLGSAFNTSGAEAATALRSGLLGESEPMRRFGVFLSEAAVQAKAAQLGIGQLGGELTDQQKVAARYAIIMEQTADSQGMFGRDSESLADSQKALQAAMEDVSAELGTALLPIMRDLTKFAKENLVPVLRAIADGISGAGKAAADNQTELGNLTNLISDLTSEGGDAKTFLGTFGKALDGLGDGMVQAGVNTNHFIGDMLDLIPKFDATGDAASGASGRIIGSTEALANAAKLRGQEIEDSYDNIGDKAVDTKTRVGRANHQMAESFVAWRDRVIGAAQDIVDKAYQIIEDKSALTAANVEKDELRKVIATGKATADQKARFKELTGEQVQLVLKLAANGAEGQKVVTDTIKDLKKELSKATGNERKAIQATIDAINRLIARSKVLKAQLAGLAGARANINKGSEQIIGGNWNPPGKATGGIAQAGVPTWVGERGKELMVPMTDTAIIPHAESVAIESRGSDSTTINLSLTGAPLQAQSPADVVRELRRASRLGLTPSRKPKAFAR